MPLSSTRSGRTRLAERRGNDSTDAMKADSKQAAGQTARLLGPAIELRQP
jgi:hypothetical protein